MYTVIEFNENADIGNLLFEDVVNIWGPFMDFQSGENFINEIAPIHPARKWLLCAMDSPSIALIERN